MKFSRYNMRYRVFKTIFEIYYTITDRKHKLHFLFLGFLSRTVIMQKTMPSRSLTKTKDDITIINFLIFSL